MSDWENGLPGGQYRFAPEGLEQHKARSKGAADALSAATRSGEDIALDEGAARAVLGKAREILAELAGHKSQAETLRQMTPPSPDMASEAYNKLATDGEGSVFAFATALTSSVRPFDAAVSEINTQYDYLTKFVQSLEKALGITVSNDADAAKAAQQAGAPKSDDGGYI